MTLSKDFALITEGVTDQIVLEKVLYSYFQNGGLAITFAKPPTDYTDTNGGPPPFGWGNLRDHCQSDEFLDHFAFAKYVVIQLDAYEAGDYGVARPDLKQAKGLMTLIENIREKVREWIGMERYSRLRDRILFAIAVDEMECWLLPAYSDDIKVASSTSGCLHKLGRLASSQEGFYLHEKDRKHYEIMARRFKKNKDLLRLGVKNPSFKVFLEALEPLKDEFRPIET